MVLKDGSTGFVFSDRLKMTGSGAAAGSRPNTPQPPASGVQAPPPLKETPGQAGPVERRDCEQCPVLVAVPAGTLTMGSGDDPTEKPVHKVAIPAFLLAKQELSFAELDRLRRRGRVQLSAAANQFRSRPHADDQSELRGRHGIRRVVTEGDRKTLPAPLGGGMGVPRPVREPRPGMPGAIRSGQGTRTAKAAAAGTTAAVLNPPTLFRLIDLACWAWRAELPSGSRIAGTRATRELHATAPRGARRIA